MTDSNDQLSLQPIIISSTILLLLSISYLYITNRHSDDDHDDNTVDKQHTNTSTRTNKTKNNPQPYSCFNHPYRPFIDKVIIGPIFSKILPLSSLSNYTNLIQDAQNMTQDEKEMLTHIKNMRQKMEKMETPDHYQQCKSWNKLLQQYGTKNAVDKDCLVGGTVLFPRKSNILSDWNIVNYKDQRLGCHNNTMDENFVKVELICPLSLIQGTYKIENENDIQSKGYKTIATTQFKDLKISTCNTSTSSSKDDDVQYIIWFHGGGMVLGGPKNGQIGFGYIKSVIEMQCKKTSCCPPVVFLSVNYDLAPEHTFPVPIIDGLSVANRVLEHCDTSTSMSHVHFAGVSAGGNLSSVIGFESFRHFEKSGNCRIQR